LRDGLCRFVNEEPLTEGETCVTEFNKKESTYTLTLTGDVKAKQGKVKVVAKNNGGEASSEAELVISGRLPEFTAKPIKCTVLEGINQSINQSIDQSVTCITTPLFVVKAASRRRWDEPRNQLKTELLSTELGLLWEIRVILQNTTYLDQKYRKCIK